MTTSAALRENSLNDLEILFEIRGAIYTRTSISEFIYENEINKAPSGFFTLSDSGKLDSMGIQSGSNGFLYFSNTTDENKMKQMTLPIYISEVELVDKKDTIFYYKIKWVAGSLGHMNVKPGDIIARATSVDALRRILEVRNSPVIAFSGPSKPTDSMNWLIMNKNMWEQLGMVVDHSFLPNDYIFWCWDDVNNSFRISSINTEFKENDTHVFIRDPNSLNNTDNVKQSVENVGLFIWKYTSYKNYNTLGSSYKKLFPNVAFLGIPSGIIKSGNIKRENFMDVLLTFNDTKLKDILKQTGLGAKDAIFGDLQIKKMNLNGHQFYPISDIYREYKLSTYAKVFTCQLYNSIGPKLGSYVSLIHNYNTSEGVTKIDPIYSDKYFIKKKILHYQGTSTNATGRKMESTTNYQTTLVLVSDNYGEGTENLKPITDKLQ